MRKKNYPQNHHRKKKITTDALEQATQTALQKTLPNCPFLFSIQKENHQNTKYEQIYIKIGIIPFNKINGQREPLFYPTIKSLQQTIIKEINQHKNTQQPIPVPKVKNLTGCYQYQKRKKIITYKHDDQTEQYLNFLLSWNPAKYTQNLNEKELTQITTNIKQTFDSTVEKITKNLNAIEKIYIESIIKKILTKKPHSSYGKSLKKEIKQIEQKNYHPRYKKWLKINQCTTLTEALTHYLIYNKKRHYNQQTALQYFIQTEKHQKYIQTLKKQSVPEEYHVILSISNFLEKEINPSIKEKILAEEVKNIKTPLNVEIKAHKNQPKNEEHPNKNDELSTYETTITPQDHTKFTIYTIAELKDDIEDIVNTSIQNIITEYNFIPTDLKNNILNKVIPDKIQKKAKIKVQCNKNKELQKFAAELNLKVQDIIQTIAIYKFYNKNVK